MAISGFTFVHNGIAGGYPFVEAILAVRPFVDEIVAVDMESDDGTLQVLKKLCDRVLASPWVIGGGGIRCLRPAHALNVYCEGDTILHFEADEVYSDGLIQVMVDYIREGTNDILVHRIQIEQNFQRIRWYPHIVHRVFPRGMAVKEGNSTVEHHLGATNFCTIGPGYGMLWDCSSTCRDNLYPRLQQQDELFRPMARPQIAGEHFTEGGIEATEQAKDAILSQPHWTYSTSPFKIPWGLIPLVGKTKYEVNLD